MIPESEVNDIKRAAKHVKMTFVKMIPVRKLCVIFVFVSMYVNESHGSVHTRPVISTPGDVRIICLLDLHESTSVTDINKCNNPQPDGLQMAFVSLWKLDKILNETGSTDIGVSVYDTCGSQERAVRILSAVISDRKKIGGVISYTSPVVTSAISGVLRHLHVLHIDITDDVTSCRDEVNCISMSLASRAKAEALQEFTRSLNWTYVTTFSLSNILATAEERLFADLVADENVCLSGRHVISDIRDVTQTLATSTSRGIMLFTGDLDLTGTSSLTVPEQSTLVIVSKNFKGLPQQLNYIRLASSPVMFEGFEQYLTKIKDNVTLQWILETSYFQGNCLTVGMDVTMMLTSCIPSESRPGSLAMLDAVSILSKALLNAVNTSCAEYDVLSCPPLSMAVTPASIRELTNYTQRSGDHDRLLVEKNTDIAMVSSTPYPLNVTEIHTQHGRLQLPSSLPTRFYNSHCVGFCSECSTCDPLLMSSERVVIQEGTIYIVGVFPIHTSSSGLTCADPNIPGFQAAQAFTAAVDRINSTGLTKDLPSDVSIGWAMFDSCGDPDWSERKHHEIEACMYKYKDANEKTIIIQPTRTVAYVNLDGEKNSLPSGKLTAAVSNLGVGVNDDALDEYAQAVMSALVKVKWTYTSVVYSDKHLPKRMFEQLENLKEHFSVCFEGVYEISHNTSAITVMRKATAETQTVILLTTLEDTKELLRILPPSSSKYRLVLFTWNVKALKNISVSSKVHEVLIVWPKPDTTMHGGLDMSGGNPWYEGFQAAAPSSSGDFFSSLDMSEASLVAHAVNTLARQINIAYTALCPGKTGICKEFADFKNLRSHIQSTKDALHTQHEISVLRFAEGAMTTVKIGKVETNGDVNLILDGSVILPQVSECTGWCPRCQQCQGQPSAASPTLYLPGDVLVAGVLPLSEPGVGTLKCGSLSTSLESEQLIEAFMFAVETYPKRYPYLLPNVKVGGLIIDSCSDISAAVQKLANFETCTTKLKSNSDFPPHPSQTLGYVLHGGRDDVYQLEQSVSAVDKLSLSTVSGRKTKDTLSRLATEFEVVSEISTIVQTLSYLNWSQIVLVISDTDTFRSKSDLLMEQASSKVICVTKLLRFNGTTLSSLQYATSQLTLTGFVPVVVVASKTDAERLFQQSSITRVPRSWLISTAGSDWSALSNFNVPPGTIIVDRKGKLSSAFAEFYSKMLVDRNSSVWWRQYWTDKLHCSLADETSVSRPACPQTLTQRETTPSQLATKVILGVDVILHAIHNEYVSFCTEKKGFCRRFAEQGINRIPTSAKTVTFEFEDEIIKFGPSGLLVASFNIISVHQQGHVHAGEWMNGQLHIDTTKLYNKDGQLTSTSTRCSDNCICLNNVETTNTFTPPEAIYWESTGMFNGELWATIIVAIAAAGAFVTLILMFYVLYKVCTGALAKRYVGLGLLLLVGVMLLYLAVLPFVFTPSDRVCALRFFAPGFTYCLCFGTVLVKMTSIRDYKLIGLGGEVSNLNQFLTVFFITGVQIAIGVQHWVLKGPFITEKNDGLNTFYACSFQRSEFLIYLVYVMFVLVLCSLYGISVRKEQKNMGEARLLLTSSWLCLVLWVAWILVLMFLDVSLTEPIISAGIMACATVMLTVIFIPKMHLVARLKYNVSKQTSSMHNGHKIDPDFMFERPYSLPGTLTSSYSSVKTYPRSIEHFDSSLSY